MAKPQPEPSSRSEPNSKPVPAVTVQWLDAPEEHDYPAAVSYLSLVMAPAAVTAAVAALAKAGTTYFAAKDLLRAARLPLLERDNVHVASDLKKIHGGKPLSPVLVLRGDASRAHPAVIADGYHRVCASYYSSENSPVAVRIVPMPTTPAS